MLPNIGHLGRFGGVGRSGHGIILENLKLHCNGAFASSVHLATGVSQWDDLSGNGNHPLQATGLDQPSYDPATGGITTDGIRQFMKTPAFTWNQPCTAYYVMRQIAWTNGDRLADGNADDTARVMQLGTTPDLQLYAGAGLTNSGLAVGADGVLAVVFNGASSLVKVNDNAAVAGDLGALNPGGLTLGRRGATALSFGNAIYYEIALYSGAHDVETLEYQNPLLMANWKI